MSNLTASFLRITKGETVQVVVWRLFRTILVSSTRNPYKNWKGFMLGEFDISRRFSTNLG
jgi:hypothetical protein